MMPLSSKNDVSDDDENEKGGTDMSGGDVTTDGEAEQPDSNEVLDGVVGNVGGGNISALL